MKKLFELKVEKDEDLVQAIKELAWQGNNAMLRGTEIILEIWGEERETLLPGRTHAAVAAS